MASQLTEQARREVLELEDVELVFDPSRSKDMITEDGQARLNEPGYM